MQQYLTHLEKIATMISKIVHYGVLLPSYNVLIYLANAKS
jgi:hypothetical protein